MTKQNSTPQVFSQDDLKTIGKLHARYQIGMENGFKVSLAQLVLAMAKDIPAKKKKRGRPPTLKASRKDYRLISMVKFYVEVEHVSVAEACRQICRGNAIEITGRTTAESLRAEYYQFMRELKDRARNDPQYHQLLEGQSETNQKKIIEWIVLNKSMDEIELGGIYKLDYDALAPTAAIEQLRNAKRN